MSTIHRNVCGPNKWSVQSIINFGTYHLHFFLSLVTAIEIWLTRVNRTLSTEGLVLKHSISVFLFEWITVRAPTRQRDQLQVRPHRTARRQLRGPTSGPIHLALPSRTALPLYEYSICPTLDN